MTVSGAAECFRPVIKANERLRKKKTVISHVGTLEVNEHFDMFINYAFAHKFSCSPNMLPHK